MVAINPVDAAGVPAGTVTDVQPSGQVPSGATVTLNVSNGAVASTSTTVETTTPAKKKGKGHGNQDD